LSDQKHLIKGIVFRLVKKHIAGSTTQSVLEAVRKLNMQGMHATVTLLNDHIEQPQQARYNTNAYVQLIKQTSRLNLNSDVSLRLTQLGYNLDRSLMGKNLLEVIAAAVENKQKVWLESENSIATEEMLALYREFKDGRACLGMEVIPDYDERNKIIGLIRSKDLIKVKCHLHKDNESKSKKESFDALKLYKSYIDGLRGAKANVTVLDHNASLIGKIAAQNKVHKDDITFEAPLGYGGKKLKSLSEKKFNMSVYVPYGKDWVPYMINHLTEGRIRNIAIALLNGENGHEHG
jgi:proline dehydrogenase